MFILTLISDLVQIFPVDFQKPSIDAIRDNLNAKYANKVLQNIGLCISVFDVLSASDGQIGHGTGIVNVNVEFRLIVFRPFKGEIILGKIRAANEHGIYVTLDFFDDIFVPQHLLFADSFYKPQEQCWVWMNDGQEYYFDRSEWVRFRIEQEEWNDQGPITQSDQDPSSSVPRKSPYSITASMTQSGLGLTSWW